MFINRGKREYIWYTGNVKGEVIMRYERILVGFDGSSYSKKALESASSMAKHYDAKLFVVYVEEPSMINQRESVLLSDMSGPDIVETPIYQVSSFSNIPKDEEPQESHGEPTPLDAARNMLSEQLDVEYVWLAGNPTTEIIKYARFNEVDVIVVGKSGVSGMEQLFIGSVSKNIVKKADCSVVVVK